MFANFFLDRPIFASVISIVIVMLGLIASNKLPIEQYPQITSPVVSVYAQFPGASADMMALSVAAPIEKALNGIEGMSYMFSQNSSPGMMNLSVYFDIGTDPDQALTDAQNSINLALPFLPNEVKQGGVKVKKSFPSALLFVALEGVYEEFFIANYAAIHVVDELRRIKGVGNAQVFNSHDYSMRIWLKPDLLAQYGLMASDVIRAIQSQSAIRSMGQIGQEPTNTPVVLTIPVNTKGQLTEPKEFEQIVVRANSEGAILRVKDVARVELGSETYDLIGKHNGKSGAYIAVYQDPTANAIDVSKMVKKKMDELTPYFPTGLTYTIPYDTSEYITFSIKKVIQTLFEAAFLVFLITLVFLRSFRAALVPLVAMLISIIGTLIGLYLLGFSINTLTLFGLVLAIGIVVDDAIVVVENVERNIRECALSSIDAAYKTMEEVSSPIIAITLVLCSVFIPVAFIGGIPGEFYKQFAITIAFSVIISGFVSLTLSPTLSALLLKKHQNPAKVGFFDHLTDKYIHGVEWLLKKPRLGIGVYLSMFLAIFLLFRAVPLGFLPDEDQGIVMISAVLPDGASLSRVETVSGKITEIVNKYPSVQDVFAFSGWGLLDSLKQTNKGSYFLSLKDWSQRNGAELSAATLIKRLNADFSSIVEAKVVAFAPPKIPGIGVIGGFDFWVVNEGDADMATLGAVINQIVEKGKTRPEFNNFITSIKADCMQLYLDLNIEKTQTLGVEISDVYQTLGTLLGSVYVNNFNKYGRIYPVIAQADPVYRDSVAAIGNTYVRSSSNKMVPLKSLMTSCFASGPYLTSRFNGSPAALISVIPNAGPGATISAMEEIAKEFLLPGMSFSWGGIAYQQKHDSGASGIALVGGLFVVFLVLAALYERWSLPFTILLAIPFGLVGALLAVWLMGMSNDIYFQIGIVALIGLSAKNAILIVEFARRKKDEGLSASDAVLQAARLRFRAIIMTSLTFIFGALPLVVSAGAGAASRQSVGVGVIGGMVMATLLSLFFVPLFFKLIEKEGK